MRALDEDIKSFLSSSAPPGHTCMNNLKHAYISASLEDPTAHIHGIAG